MKGWDQKHMKKQPQAISPTPRPRRHPPPKAASWNQPKALELAAKGVGPSDIAAAVGVSRNTVLRYLQRIRPELDALPAFKSRTGDILALNFAKCCSIEDKLLDYFDMEGVLDNLDPNQRERLLGRVVIAKAINFDKLRLQEGKSTTNLAHQLQVERVHKSLVWGPGGSVSMRIDPDEIIEQTEKSIAK